jgi:hypothetical protein
MDLEVVLAFMFEVLAPVLVLKDIEPCIGVDVRVLYATPLWN